jgi:hypothetical protein
MRERRIMSKCQTCIYFDKQPHICRRYPPQVYDGRFLWPVVNEMDWCGEHSHSERR